MSARRLLTINLGSATLKSAMYAWGGGRSEPHSEARASSSLDALPPEARSNPERWRAVLEHLCQEVHAPQDLTAVVHRIVHGGELRSPLRIDDPAIRSQLENLAPWAPLHQPAALALATASLSFWPRASHWAVFDTDWHRTLAPRHRTLALPIEWRRLGLQRFGFHGLAFQSGYRQLCASDADAYDRRVVLAHLGGGSSLCAVHRGRSVDTSMELTPSSGLPMATRSGNLDPHIVFDLLRRGLPVASIQHGLDQRSGLLGLSGLSGDMRTLMASTSEEARLAVDVYTLRVAQGIAGMAVSLGGMDDLVFSGGVGSHASAIRRGVVEQLSCLGLSLNLDANVADAQRIESRTSRCRVWVTAVDEEYELALGVVAKLEGAAHAPAS